MGRIRKPPKTCYACNRVKVSDEHVPPKCFFPEAKYLKPGQDLRKNLITVPSCDEHNIEKSKDDFYLLFVILGNYRTNTVAANYYSKKIISELKRQPSLKGLFGHQWMPAIVNGLPTGAFTLDRLRFNSTLESISRALYFYHYQRKWKGRVEIFSPDIFLTASQNAKEYNSAMKEFADKIEIGLQRERRVGKNPEVFYYQIVRERDRSHFYLRMVFYGGFVAIGAGTSSLPRENTSRLT